MTTMPKAENARTVTSYVLALPKEERLAKSLRPVMEQAGFTVAAAPARKAETIMIDNRGDLPAVDVMSRKTSDALDRVQRGTAELAIVGRDTLLAFNAAARAERRPGLEVVAPMPDVSPCYLTFAAKEESGIKVPSDMNGQTIGVCKKYESILREILDSREIEPAEIIPYEGGVEAMLDVECDVIFEMVETGNSLRAYDARELFDKEEYADLTVPIYAVVVARDQRQLSDNAFEISERLFKAANPASTMPDFTDLPTRLAADMEAKKERARSGLPLRPVSTFALQAA